MCILYDTLELRNSEIGLLTVSNHHSMLDDPILLSSILPPRIFSQPSLMRVGWCSGHICLQNFAFARFCEMGKTRPSMRLSGLGQPYLKDAANLSSADKWIHLCTQGRVFQHSEVRDDSDYFKTGSGKILATIYAQTDRLSMIITIYHEVNGDILPQQIDDNKIESFLLRVSKKVYAIAGDSVTDDVQSIVGSFIPDCDSFGGIFHGSDTQECFRFYEEIVDAWALSVRLLRVELRERARSYGDTSIGDLWNLDKYSSAPRFVHLLNCKYVSYWC